jgi:tetratricopeptide (TPR) repeat protein
VGDSVKHWINLILVGILAAPLGADAPASLALAAEAEKAGDWKEALTDYQAAYAENDDDKLPRAIGNTQAHLGLWKDASESFERYLEKHPEDTAMAAYEAKLKASLARRPAADAPAAVQAAETGVDGVTVFMKENPRDKQHFQVTIENLTPIIVGLDFAYYRDRHHDFGLGFVGLSTGTGSGNLFHPRYRYHRARFYWDSFFELGGLFGGYKEDRGGYGSNGDYYQASVTGGDLGLGVDYKSEGPWTFAFLLSFNFVGAGFKQRSTYTSTNYVYAWDPFCGCYTYSYSTSSSYVVETSSGGFVAYPLIGMSYGFIF